MERKFPDGCNRLKFNTWKDTAMVPQLIKINNMVIGRSETNAVNSRDIHKFVESKQQYADWIKSRLSELGAVDGVDFMFHKFMNPEIKSNNKTQIDYIVTLDIAKHLAMMERNEKGKQARQYFIEAEKELKSGLLPFDPNDELAMLDYAKQLIMDKRALELKIKEDRPLVSFAKSVEASVDSVLIANYAKILSDTEGVKIGQNRLFDWFRIEGYLMSTVGTRYNVPYQKYIDNGYFEVSTHTYAGSTGTHQKFTTKITGRGQIALARKIVDAFTMKESA